MPTDWKAWGDTQDGHGPETQRLIELAMESGLSMSEIAAKLSEEFGNDRSKKSCERKWARIRRAHKKSTGESLERPNFVANQQNRPVDSVPTGTYERLEFEEHGNTAIAFSNGKRIKTLPQLLEEARVDLDVWEVDHHIINKWEVAGKFGKVGDEYFEIEELWQVKVWLVRKQPIQIYPVVSPVTIRVTPIERSLVTADSEIKYGLILPDPQFGFFKSLRTAKLTPFHDRLALDISLQIAHDLDCEYVCWLGDFLDLADWSDKFTRDPNYYWTTQPAAIEGKWWMTQHRQANLNARMKLIEGNHESRIREQLNKHLKEAFGLRSVDNLELPPLMSIPRILALHELDIEWIGEYPNGESWINDYIVCDHGAIARAKSGSTVSAMVSDANETRIIGHIHRIESATKTIHERTGARSVAVHSVGCLCRTDGVVPGVKAKQNWQQAVGIVEYYLDGREDHRVTTVPIHNGRAILNGKLYEGRDRTEELREDVIAMYDDDAGWNF